MDEVVYSERVGYPFWLPLGLGVACLGLAAGIVAGGVTGQVALLVICAVVLVFLVAVFALMSSLTFEVTKEEISFGFPIYRKRFPRSSLVSCRPFELTFANYLGMGIRIGRDGSVALNTRLGPGVWMEFEGAKRPFAVSVDDPERACAAMNGP